MIIVIILGIVCIYFAYLEGYKGKKNGLLISFTLIFIFLAIRYDFGNDYLNYLTLFDSVNRLNDFMDIFQVQLYGEIGWIILCRLFRQLGFFTLIAFLAFFNCAVYYSFIKKYVVPKYYWLAVFIYIFNSSFLLVHSTAMRQSVAISIFIIAIQFALKNRVLLFVLLVILASFFHSSAIILLPIYLVVNWEWKFNFVEVSAIILSFIILIFSMEYLPHFINNIVGKYFTIYYRYLELSGVEIKSGLGIIFEMFLFLFLLIYSKFQHREITPIVKIYLISFYFIPLSMLSSMLSRSGMYFTPAAIVVFPMSFYLVKDVGIRRIIMSAFILYILYTFYVFYNSAVWKDSFQVYKTIFSLL
jgi:transmembrane protein EpsG